MKVNVAAKPVITASVEKASVFVGETATYTAVANNTSGAVTYQWQRSKPGTSWSNTKLGGYNTDTLSFDATADRLSYQYRCKVTDAHGSWFSNAVKINVTPSPVITASAAEATVFAGDFATFTVVTENTEGNLTYQWQRFKTGSSWSNTKLGGYNTDTLSFEATADRLSYQYRCRVTDANGNWFSNAVKVDVAAKPVITATADRESAFVGETVTMTVIAANLTGEAVYQWQYSETGGNADWQASDLPGSDTATLAFEATQLDLSRYYRCEVQDEKGIWYSNILKVELETIVVDGVTYEKITDTTLCVVSYSGSASALVIPETIQGMTVTEIGVEAFMNNTALTAIDLPDTIMVIKARAFKGCTHLSQMTTH